MNIVARKHTLVPDLFEWAESFPPFSTARSFRGPQIIRIEDALEEGHYVIRAELPGIDPDNDVKVTVADGLLVIDAERTEEKHDKSHSEFRYGSFRRVLPLPPGAKSDDITARYADGILTVTVGVADSVPQNQPIPIERG